VTGVNFDVRSADRRDETRRTAGVQKCGLGASC
jgi:hypothetical protein